MRYTVVGEYGFGFQGETYMPGESFDAPGKEDQRELAQFVANGEIEEQGRDWTKLSHAELDEAVAADHRFEKGRIDYPKDGNKAEKVAWIEEALATG